ncbi:MAG: hypothetical protein R3B70_36045 [Polyangiaceae bacterium]
MRSLMSALSQMLLSADVPHDAIPAAAKKSSISLDLLLVWLHVAGNLVWIGAAVSMGVILAWKEGEPKVRGALARRIHLRLAMPAFGVSFVAALLRTGMDLKGYFVQHHWMHGKLPFAIAVIAIHHILGARARKMEGRKYAGGRAFRYADHHPAGLRNPRIFLRGFALPRLACPSRTAIDAQRPSSATGPSRDEGDRIALGLSTSPVAQRTLVVRRPQALWRSIAKR